MVYQSNLRLLEVCRDGPVFHILVFYQSHSSTGNCSTAWSGGFIMLWLYAQPWFLDFTLFGVNMQNLFQIHPINLSVAVWVGFLALFGIASDDGVVMATYLQQSFKKNEPDTIEHIRDATVIAGKRRIRACLMTTASCHPSVGWDLDPTISMNLYL